MALVTDSPPMLDNNSTNKFVEINTVLYFCRFIALQKYRNGIINAIIKVF